MVILTLVVASESAGESTQMSKPSVWCVNRAAAILVTRVSSEESVENYGVEFCNRVESSIRRRGVASMLRRMGATMIALGITFLMAPELSRAECRGLDLPPPQTLNICETLIEDLLVPGGTEVFCDVPWYAPPHCHVPGACHVDPVCKSFERIQEVASILLHAGDLYCDPREVEAEEIVEKVAMDLYADTTALTTGGASSILFKVANVHIDFIECNAAPLSPALKDVIANVVADPDRSRNDHFYPVDVDEIRIIARSRTALGSLYLREGYGAITLGNVVILRDHFFEQLDLWDHPWGEARFGHLTQEEEEALSILIHELIHIRQYREIGKEQFINRYLTEALKSGYGSISMETEAYDFQSWADKQYNQLVAASIAALLVAALH